MELMPEYIAERNYEGIWSERQQENIDWWGVSLLKLGSIYAVVSNDYEHSQKAGPIYRFYDNLPEARADYESLI